MPRVRISERCWRISEPAPCTWSRASGPTAFAFNIRRSRTIVPVTIAADASPSSTIRNTASRLGASAAMAAVIRSRRSGTGALIDLSQYECGLMFMGAALHDFFSTGHLAQRCGNDDPIAVPHGAYPCADGEWIALSCWSDD